MSCIHDNISRSYIVLYRLLLGHIMRAYSYNTGKSVSQWKHWVACWSLSSSLSSMWKHRWLCLVFLHLISWNDKKQKVDECWALSHQGTSIHLNLTIQHNKESKAWFCYSLNSFLCFQWLVRSELSQVFLINQLMGFLSKAGTCCTGCSCFTS